MEPFKATKLWNKIIQDFRSLMPLKRHRWRMRPYDNCFTTTEAVDWLHEYLQSSSDFGPWVTRNQAVSLLEKFVQIKVIQQVKVGRSSKSKLSAAEQSFEDNGQLYRFVPVSPIKKLRSAFSSRSNLRNSPKGSSPELPQKPSVPKMESLDDPPPPKPRRTISDPPPPTRTISATTRTISATTQVSTASQTSLTTHRQQQQQQQVRHGTPVAAVQEKVHQGGLQAKPLGPYNGGGLRTQSETSSSSSSVMQQCRLVSRNLTMREIEEVWKSATLIRLQRLLWLSSLQGLLNADVVNPRNLMHNCTHVSRSGVVVVSNKQEDLPHWVLSAMRCLARWPNQTDSSLPAYPGFERDVFKTVFNYFDTLCEPLMTYALYPLVTEAFIIAEQRERGIAPPGYEEAVGMSTTARGMSTFESVENLMLNMTMGGSYDSVPSPGGYANPPIATPHGALDGPSNGCSNFVDTQEGASERDKPVYRRSVSMHIETIPQIQHGGGGRRRAGGNHRQSLSQQNGLGSNRSGSQTLSQTSLHECQSYYEAENHRNLNRMGDISEYYRYNPDKYCCTKKSRPHSAHGFVGACKYKSETNIHEADGHFADYQPRHFGSMTAIGTSEDPIPYIDDPCPRVIGCSPQYALPSPISNTNPASTHTTPSSDGSFHSAFESVPNSADPSPTTSEPSQANQSGAKETAFSRLFRSSKKFGSASDLVQRILRKKSDSSLSYGVTNSSNSSTNHTPPVTAQSSAHRSATNSAPSSKNNSPTETSESQKISPSYPPPMRATLSMSQVISSAENSANNTPDNPQTSFGQRSVSTYDLNQIWPPPRPLDPFQQGLSQSSHNLRSSQPGLSQHYPHHQHGFSQSSRNLKSSQPGLNQWSRVSSAYSLNRSGVSELGGPHMKRSDSASSLYLNEDQSYMQESLKLCCLLLPPSNRRKLHLLLKLMCKIEQNDDLQLSSTRTPRNLVLHTFTRCILRCREEIDLNETLAIRIVEYLMDNHATIFAVPQDLKKDVDERLVYLRRGQIKYTPDDMSRDPPAFCRQISVAEYEKQKVASSQTAMEGLLDNILQDNRMTAKEKRRRLKQFQRAYPEIYAKRMQKPSFKEAENVHPSSHCQKVSTKDYEAQSLSASQRALEALLENIISSDQMPPRDKKKKLKRFEKEYPDLYRKRLPTSESEAQLFRPTQKPRIKPPMVNMKKSFRWKSIR